jgi:hypothetical protein
MYVMSGHGQYRLATPAQIANGASNKMPDTLRAPCILDLFGPSPNVALEIAVCGRKVHIDE